MVDLLWTNLFTDLEPRAAGTSGDGYIGEYLYTISPSDVIKFDSLNFIPLPVDWETNSVYQTVRNNAITSGQLKLLLLQTEDSLLDLQILHTLEFLSEAMELVQSVRLLLTMTQK